LLLLLRMSSLEEFATAIETGDSSTLELLISNGSVDVNARLPRQNRPPALVLAAACGQKDFVDILLRANARIDETDREAGRRVMLLPRAATTTCLRCSLLANRMSTHLMRLGRPRFFCRRV
jgi:hypothetical protein